MALDYTVKYASKIANRFKLASKTNRAAGHEYEFTGAKSVKIYSMVPAELTDYQRGGKRYGDVTDLEYGDFVTPGIGHDSITGKEGWIDNAGQGSGYYGMDGEGHWGYYLDPELTQKHPNGRWGDYASSDGGYVRMGANKQPDMTAQDLSRAGQTVILTGPGGTFRVTYNDRGYPVASVRTSTDYTPGLIPVSYTHLRAHET